MQNVVDQRPSRSFGNLSLQHFSTGAPEFVEDQHGDERPDTDRDIAEGEDHVPEPVDVKYRSATERVWPAEKHQRKFGAKVQRALASLLSSRRDNSLQTLVNMGFTVEEVRMSPDNLIAYILWSCLPGQEEQAERTLRHSAGRMRGSLAHAMQVRRVPRLEFRLNELTAQQQQIEDILQRLDREG
ncbi:hypothetical protein WJX73_005628 [Symbiochloris irregularis]|uniref:Ribosome-binding factor A n=1 Tax=Symbiochloris irregularis TaxID=706552 RepID=A0AAW1PZG0_9CHLO